MIHTVFRQRGWDVVEIGGIIGEKQREAMMDCWKDVAKGPSWVKWYTGCTEEDFFKSKRRSSMGSGRLYVQLAVDRLAVGNWHMPQMHELRWCKQNERHWGVLIVMIDPVVDQPPAIRTTESSWGIWGRRFDLVHEGRGEVQFLHSRPDAKFERRKKKEGILWESEEGFRRFPIHSDQRTKEFGICTYKSNYICIIVLGINGFSTDGYYRNDS